MGSTEVLGTADPIQAPPTERLRLHYLDGLRGLAAFWVVLHHVFLEVAAVPGWLPDRWARVNHWAWNGQIGVQVFIVLSGYCLMMPVARSGSLKGGWTGFIKRRARRILPPYYAALALSLVVTLLVPGMNAFHGLRWDRTLPATSWGALGSHLLLVQDVREDWIFTVNHAMWTIAQEWQIYFVFALLLLPLWRAAGILSTLAFSLVVSIVLRRLPVHDFAYAAPEFLFLFAVGMFAATVSFAGDAGWIATMRAKTPWGLLTAIVWVAYTGLMLKQTDPARFHALPFALLAACAMFCTLVSCTAAAQRRRGQHPLLSVCELPTVVILGTFSYSLYLVHAPILAVCSLALRNAQVAGPAALAVEMFIAVPVAVALAYAFHLVAERPFMLGHPRTLPRAEKAAVLDTAP